MELKDYFDSNNDLSMLLQLILNGIERIMAGGVYSKIIKLILNGIESHLFPLDLVPDPRQG